MTHDAHGFHGFSRSKAILLTVMLASAPAHGAEQSSERGFPIGIYAVTDQGLVKLEYYSEAYVAVNAIRGVANALSFQISQKAKIPRVRHVRSFRINKPGWPQPGQLHFLGCREGKGRDYTEYQLITTAVSKHGIAVYELMSADLSDESLMHKYTRMNQKFGDGVSIVEGFVGVIISTGMGDPPRFYPVQVFPPP